ETEVARRGTAVELIAGNVALLNTHNAQSLRAVWRTAEWRTGFHEQPRHGATVPRRHADFIGELTGERNSVESCCHAAPHREFTSCHVREGFVTNVELPIDEG